MKYPEQESSTLEFKREIPKNEQIIKTMIGFCNQQGGRLIIGVEQDGSIVGIEEAKANDMMEYLEKSTFEASYPPVIPKVYTQRLGNKLIMIIEVAEGMSKPYHLRRDGPDKGVYIRLGRSTLRATPEIINELEWSSHGISYDRMPLYNARETDLDMQKIHLFLTTRKNAIHIDIESTAFKEALYAYNILTRDMSQEYPTVGGILLFGKKPQYFFSEARIMCNHFTGRTLGPEVIASQECLGTLDTQFTTAYNFILNRLTWSWHMKGVKRIEELEIPIQAVREMVMNAIIHRNYHIPGPNKIAIFDNRLEIFSQGSFPGPIGNNLQAGFTYLRNTMICKIFREMGLIENFGFGFITTFSSYEQAGLINPQIIEGENYIKCVLPRRVPENLLARTHDQDETSQHILKLFTTASEISVADLIMHLHLKRPTATRKLAELVKKGTLIKIGAGRAVRYKLAIKSGAV